MRPLLAVCFCAAFAVLIAPAAAASVFVPHQALYELSLQKAKGNSTIEAARGRIYYRFGGSDCEGYTSDLRQVSELDNGEGKTTQSDLHTTSWEDAAGKTFRFKVSARMNDADPALVDGVAERSGNKVTVKLKKPVAKSFSIDGETVFPTEQMRRIVDAARAGKSLLELQVYDGSETGEKVYSTLTVIGRQVSGERAAKAADPATDNSAMKDMPRWPVTVSYFDRGAKNTEGEQTPAYAMSFELYENGVTRGLVIDYNAFVVAGDLTKFDIKPSKPCK